VFVTGKHLQQSLMFASKARSLPYSGVIHSIGPGLTHKHWTRPERLERDKHSSLLKIRKLRP
jgi:hypothetical protein